MLKGLYVFHFIPLTNFGRAGLASVGTRPAAEDHFHAIQASLACCGLLVTSVAAAVVATSPQPPPLAKFPGGVVSVLRQLDGSTVCSSSDVFLATDDPHRWAFVPVEKDRLPKYSSLRPIGGDRSRSFFVNTGNASSSLVAVSPGGRTTVLRSMPGFWAAFASRDVGAIAGGSDVFITGDGAETWNQAASLESHVEVSALTWVSDSGLLVGGAAGSAQLMERREGNKLRKCGPPRPLPEGLPASHWMATTSRVNGQSLQRLSLADGHVDTTLTPTVHIEGLAACHQRLLISGTMVENGVPAFSISIWGPQGRRRIRASEKILRAGDTRGVPAPDSAGLFGYLVRRPGLAARSWQEFPFAPGIADNGRAGPPAARPSQRRCGRYLESCAKNAGPG